MTIKNKILSVFLAVLMFTSVFTAFPPMEVWADDGTVPSVKKEDPDVGSNYVTLKGKITANGGVNIEKYGFGYIINHSSSEYNWGGLKVGTISNNVLFTYKITGLNPGDFVDYVVAAKNCYGEAKPVYGYVWVPIKVSEDELDFSTTGGSDTFTVTSSSDYTISESLSWISLNTVSESSSKTITVTCSKNTGAEREGTITVEHTGSGDTFEIEVHQDGQDLIGVSEEELEFDADGGKDTFKITASSAYTITTNVTWITLSSKSGSTDKTITVTCSENTSTSSRSGVITVKHTATGDTYEIDVEQEGAEITWDCTFEPKSSYLFGEELDFSGKITSNATIEKVTIGFYDTDNPDVTGGHYYTTAVNSKTYYLSGVPAFTVGNAFTNKGPSGGTIDISDCRGIDIIIWIKVKDQDDAITVFNKTVLFDKTTVPAVDYINASGSGMTFTFTVTCNKYANHGILLYADEYPLDINWEKSISGNSIVYTGTVAFSLSGERKITAYALDSNGNCVLDSDAIKSITINAKSKGVIDAPSIITPNPSTVKKGDGLYLSWNRPTNPVGVEIKYNIYVLHNGDNVCVNVAPITTTSYTIPAKYFSAAGDYIVSVIAIADDYTQSNDDDSAIAVKVVTNGETRGDINNDGEITNKDRFYLNRYLKKMTGYTSIDLTIADINLDGKVNEEDAIYLANHLAGVKGYESFPNYDAHCLHTDCQVSYAGKTVFVNNTNKSDGIHSYYHMWSSICKACGENLGVFQGNDAAEKGAVEQKACTYNFEGYCSCGALNTSNYVSWNGYIASAKTVTVYETPYSSTWYGSVFENEKVTVLGEIGERYFIKYTVSTTKSDKYGYVPTDTIRSSATVNSIYSISFDFETITLPASGRNVLLIPKDGSGFFYVYKDGKKISDISSLKNFKLVFSKNNVICKGTTLVGGKEGGYGALTVSFEDTNGNVIYVSSPKSYIVAESTSVYSSSDKSVFSENEKEYIRMTLDMALSGGNIKRPRDADFTYGDNVLLNIEKVWDMLASLARLKNPTIEQCSAVLAAYLEAYNDGTIGEYTDTSFFTSLSAILTQIWDFGIGFPYENFSNAFSTAIKTIQSYKGKPFSVTAAKDIVKSLKVLYSNADELADLFDICPKLVVDLAKNGFSVKEFSKTLDAMSKSEKFFEFMEILSLVGDVVAIGTDIFSAGCILFGSYDKQRSLLEDIREVLIQAGYTKNDVQIKAIDNLIVQYDSSFLTKLQESKKALWGDIVSLGAEIALSNGCPLFGVLLSVVQIAAGNTTVAEEAEYTMFKLISHAYICALDFTYEMFATGEMTCSLEEAKTKIQLYITMAIHENVLAISASDENGEFSIDEKEQFKSNITLMKKVYSAYLN